MIELTYGNALPPYLAARFTPAQLSVMNVLAHLLEGHTVYDATNGQLAELAGASVGAVRNALRLAKKLELIELEQLPHPDNRLIANKIRLHSKEWSDWLARPRRRVRKMLLSIHIDEDVVHALRRSGPDWQEKVEQALREVARRGKSSD